MDSRRENFPTVAAADDYLQTRLLTTENFRQFATIHALRHDDIRQQQIHLSTQLLPPPDRLRTRSRVPHPVPATLQCDSDQFADVWVILDQQDRLVSAGGVIKPAFAALRGAGASSRRQEYSERGTAPKLADHLDPAVVLLDNAVNRRQSQPRSLADFLGRKERFKDARARLLAHAGAGVGDGQDDEPAPPRLRIAPGLVRPDLAHLGADEETSALGHDIAGVDREIHDDLLQHACVRLHGRQVGRIAALQRDVFTEDPLQHFQNLAEHGVQVETADLHRLFPAEHQQLPGQIRATLGGRGDLSRQIPACIPEFVLFREQTGGAEDDGENIVEIMGHPSRQLTDGFELLGLTEPGLEFLAFGDVPGDRKDGRAPLQLEGLNVNLHRNPAAIPRHVRLLKKHAFPASELPDDALAIHRGLRSIDVEHRHLQECFTAVTEALTQGVVHGQERARQIVLADFVD